MKAPLTLTLAAALTTPPLPAAAQFPYMPPPRYTPPPPYTAPSSDWARVRAIAPRSPIRVTAIGLGGQDHQYFVSASERTLTLLVVGGVPRSAKRLLIALAGSHPELFTAPDKWMEFRDGKARANPDGLFIGNRKIADLSDVAKTIDAGDVAEVAAELTVPRLPSRDVEPVSPLVAGTFVAALYGTMALCKDRCGSAALLPILGAPFIAGALAARKTARVMQVVYRVP